MVSAGQDHLGGGLSVDCVMHFVLHRSEEFRGERILLVVVDARGVDVGNLLRAATDGEISIAYDLIDLITERKYNRNKNLRNELDSYVSDASAGP